MSDIGLLSHQYQALAEFSRELRQYIIYIKRLYYGLPRDTDEALDAKIISYLHNLINFLSEVINLNDEVNRSEVLLENTPLPISVVERLQHNHELDYIKYSRSLQRFLGHLDGGLKNVTDKDIEILEEIAQTANLDTNLVFRRLMRWG